ncbi:hypothetical protein HF521_017633 [Silurus meridionalis]|uniref:Uncharacterized protein n=1 Tax=Silurus meridionalis TaxID=175797 RepID=A0A8T0BSZ7_SILME|nr:hypothetical protein HF521_017633 [Silurus meridionalis]
MMRTLQKPRKNKPSKRQVNHRRFLHNMIQRKFAEIESANHQLASAIFSVDAKSQRQSEIKSTPKHESEKHPKKATAVFGVAETKHLEEDTDTITLDSIVINRNGCSLKSKSLNKQNKGKNSQIREDGDLVEQSDENSPQEIIDFMSRRQQIHCGSADSNDLISVSNNILKDSVFTSLESTEKIPETLHVQIPNLPDEEQYLGLTLFELSPTSPVSPLSLNSCDFEVQIQPENDHTSQIQHTAESLQMDLMENLELLDSEEYLQQIDQMDMAAVWDIHTEEDLSCFQDNLPLLNASQTDVAMDKKATCGDGDIFGGLQQISTLLQNSAKNMNVQNELRSNIIYSLAHCGSSGHHNQVGQTGQTVDCSINQPDISTAVNKGDQYLTGGKALHSFFECGCEKFHFRHKGINEAGHDGRFSKVLRERLFDTSPKPCLYGEH